jgi:dynein heavy chain
MGTWTTWTSLIESQALGNIISRTEQIITTSETVRQTFFINKLVEMKKMVLLVGPTGTGKTSVIKSYLYRLPKDEYLINNLNFSARTTASQTQDTILSKLTRY